MQPPALIPQEQAKLWSAARAWFAKIMREMFATGLTAIGDGKRPELIGWLGRIEEIIRSLIIAAALILRPGDIGAKAQAAVRAGNVRCEPTFAPAQSLPAFMTLPSALQPAKSGNLAAQAATAIPEQATRATGAVPDTRSRTIQPTDPGGELTIRILVLQRVMANPERLIRRLARRCLARATRDSLAIVSWAIDHLQTQHSDLMQALANACRDAALDAAALFRDRHPKLKPKPG